LVQISIPHNGLYIGIGVLIFLLVTISVVALCCCAGLCLAKYLKKPKKEQASDLELNKLRMP
jgi:hypothetical protein